MMNIREPVRSAFASLKANKLRSALTTLGIVIGVSAVVTVVGLIQGFRGTIYSVMERFGSNVISVRPVSSWDMPSEEYKKVKNRDITLDDMRALARALPQVITSVTPATGSYSDAKYSGRSTNLNVIMTDETWFEQNRFNLAIGRNFVPADMRLKSKVAIIGWPIIKRLGISGNPVGQYISTLGMSLEIVGVMEELGGAGVLGEQDIVMFIPITTGMATLPDNRRRQLSFDARYDPNLDVDDVEDLVRDALRRIRGVKSNEVEGFNLTTMKQEVDTFNTIFAAITGIAGGMVGIALLVGGVGIMNIMLVSVTERTREIGVRKAVGAKRRHIMLQFLVEATVLCLLGGALGILIGFVVGNTLSKILFNQIRAIPMWAFVAGFGVPAAIGIFFGYYPAAKASKLDPIESLRYE